MAYYKYSEDRNLIVGAFCRTFGMSVSEFNDLTAYEYNTLFPSIDSETTFSYIVRTRCETDKDRIKNFSSSELAEWEKYRKRKAKFDERNRMREEMIKQSEEYKKKQEEILNKRREARQKLREMGVVFNDEI